MATLRQALVPLRGRNPARPLYWYLRWREGARQRRRYVPREQVNAIREAIEQRRRLRPPAWSLQQELAGLRRLAQEVRNDGHEW